MFNYDVIKVLSRGSITKPCVVLAQLQQQRRLQVVVRTAAPLSQLTNRETGDFSKRLEQLKSLRHCNVVRYYGGSLLGGEVTVLLDYLPGGSLGDYISIRRASNKPLEDQVVLSYLSQLAAGLQYCHQQQLVHCALRSTCLFLDKPKTRLVIANFGLTAVSSVPKPTGLSWCEAPELGAGSPNTPSSDMWAVGVILAEMLNMAAPPIYVKYPSRLSCSAVLGELLLALLSEEPASRPQAAKLKQRLDELISSSGGIEEIAGAVKSSLKSAAIPSALRKDLLKRRASRRLPSKSASKGGQRPTTSLASSGRQAKDLGSATTSGDRLRPSARSKQIASGSSDRPRQGDAKQWPPSTAKSLASTTKRTAKSSSQSSPGVAHKSLPKSTTGGVTKSPSVVDNLAMSIGRNLLKEMVDDPGTTSVTSSLVQRLGFGKSGTSRTTTPVGALLEAGKAKRTPKTKVNIKTAPIRKASKTKTSKLTSADGKNRNERNTVNKKAGGHRATPSKSGKKEKVVEDVVEEDEDDAGDVLEEEEHEVEEEEELEEQDEEDNEEDEENLDEEEDDELEDEEDGDFGEEEVDSEEELEEEEEEFEEGEDEEDLEEEEEEEGEEEEEEEEEDSEDEEEEEEEEDYGQDEFDGADTPISSAPGCTNTLPGPDTATAELSFATNRESEATTSSGAVSPAIDALGSDPLHGGKEPDPLHEKNNSGRSKSGIGSELLVKDVSSDSGSVRQDSMDSNEMIDEQS